MSSDLDAPILLRTDSLIAVSKPAGLVVIPAAGEPAASCLQRRLEATLGHRLWVVHRIDRDTSGVVLFALTAEAHRLCSLAFEARRVEKTYLAFVHGRPGEGRGRIDAPLHDARRGKARPARPGEPGARTATTEYEAIRSWRLDGLAELRGDEAFGVTLVSLRPFTGRHHQLRVHLRSIGVPILFDPLYGSGHDEALDEAPCQRLALHAQRLVLPAGDAGPAETIEAPLPADLSALAHWLDANGEREDAS